MKAPCYNCSDRQQLCHSHCEKYRKFRAGLDKVNEARRENVEKRFFCVDVKKKIAA